MKIVVIGAGIGGLTAAVALSAQAHDVVVVEKRESFQDEGAGVVLGPNVMSALAVLGLAEPIHAAGRPVTTMNVTDRRGRVLSRSAYRVDALPFPGVAIHRTRLHAILREHFHGELRLGATMSRLAPGEPPAVSIGDERLECDLVIGADGIRSAVRQSLDPAFTTRYAGATCFRYVVDRQWTDEVFEMWGPGKRIGVVPLGGGRTYVFLTLNAAPRAPKPFADLAQFRAIWSEFSEPGREALHALDDLGRVLHNDLEDGIAARFRAPGVVLIGDAAHAVTPNMGQGAGLAVEDACCLAHVLGQGPLADALAEYERLRRPRATWIRGQSFTLGRIAQLRSPLACWLRNLVVRLTPASVSERALRRILTDMPGVPGGFGQKE
jgi:2-heptyl-3-hydroxy-4(1H)-quinolone synthase